MCQFNLCDSLIHLSVFVFYFGKLCNQVSLCFVVKETSPLSDIYVYILIKTLHGLFIFLNESFYDNFTFAINVCFPQTIDI